jgi:5-methylthioadenosine/S-adenosylhomocysteine deaminase
MATIDGAGAGVADEVGSLEVGKRADVTVIDLSATHIEPWGEASARLVYAAQSRDVRHVVVDGRVRVCRSVREGTRDGMHHG